MARSTGDAPGAEGGYDEGLPGGSLADTAQAGLGDVAEANGTQDALDGMQYNTHMAFLGMGYRTQDTDYKLGDEVAFIVRGRVTHVGDQLMKDDHERHIVKVDIQSVNPADSEPNG